MEPYARPSPSPTASSASDPTVEGGAANQKRVPDSAFIRRTGSGPRARRTAPARAGGEAGSTPGPRVTWEAGSASGPYGRREARSASGPRGGRETVSAPGPEDRVGAGAGDRVGARPLLPGAAFGPEEGRGEFVHLRFVGGPQHLRVGGGAERPEARYVVGVDDLEMCQVVTGVAVAARGAGGLDGVECTARSPSAWKCTWKPSASSSVTYFLSSPGSTKPVRRPAARRGDDPGGGQRLAGQQPRPAPGRARRGQPALPRGHPGSSCPVSVSTSAPPSPPTPPAAPT